MSLRFRCTLVLFFALLSLNMVGQTKKTVEAQRISHPLVIDGYLNEAAYSHAAPAKDFVQLQPYNGKPSFQPTEAYFFYDETALYVGAMLYDSNPDSIFNFLTERDNIGMSDYFGVYIDPYNQGQIAYGFFITPAGVQVDIKAAKSSDDNEDGNWDAVWESKTRIANNGWIVEMRIPYSALRFSDKSGATWGLNMFRNIRRYNSNNSWNFVDRKLSGFIHQEGQLTGLKNIKPPVRLSLSPYMASYFEPKANGKSSFMYKAGLDLKYGINDAFTLDMMVIPDFGQVQADDQELNLSPYELYYDEKRQFFTEGTELFDRGDVFYSRRIGAAPKFSADNALNNNESITFNPAETQLVNATKVSGRNNKGWGLGVLNAMTLPAYAKIKNNQTGDERKEMVQPFTNYNVLVVDKSLKNNSYLSIINTNMAMVNNPFYANVTATEFELKNNSKTYALKGTGGVSTRYNDGKQNGFGGKLGVERIKGKFYWGLTEHIYTDQYNPNDLGYLQRNNRVTTEAWVMYQIIEPFWIFREINGDIWWNYNRMYNPNALYDNEMGYDLNMRLKNNYHVSSNFFIRTNQYDYYEPRVAGRFFYDPYSYYFNFEVESDFRKPLTVNLEYKYSYQPDLKHYSNEYETDITWRIGQKLNLNYEMNYSSSKKEQGYASMINSTDSIVFARRNVHTLSNTIEATYVLNTKSGLSLRTRHYWSGVENNRFYLLQNDGKLRSFDDFDGSADQNYNAFTIDLVFRWIFAPGSEMSLAWKTLSYTNGETTDYHYWNNLKNSWLNKNNVLSLKILYYIDYNKIFTSRANTNRK